MPAVSWPCRSARSRPARRCAPRQTTSSASGRLTRSSRWGFTTPGLTRSQTRRYGAGWRQRSPDRPWPPHLLEAGATRRNLAALLASLHRGRAVISVSAPLRQGTVRPPVHRGNAQRDRDVILLRHGRTTGNTWRCLRICPAVRSGGGPPLARDPPTVWQPAAEQAGPADGRPSAGPTGRARSRAERLDRVRIDSQPDEAALERAAEALERLGDNEAADERLR